MTATMGERIVHLRRRRGLTQAELVQGIPVSHSYLSLIESGKRVPTRRILVALAERLGTTPEYLLTGRGLETRTLELDLRFAEVALRSGDAAAARERFAAVLDQAARQGDAYSAERYEALYGLSCANEALGDLDAALRGFEQLAATADLPSSVNRTTIKIWLCRAYMQSGDLGRAIDLGEAALAELDGPLDAFVSEEMIELASTLVLAYYERGDLTRAKLLIDSVVLAAEANGSLRARATAYWNAAIVAEGRGEIRAAHRLTERALALYSEVGNAWAMASLRANSGALLLRLQPPQLVEAAALLRQALTELLQVGSPADIATAEAEMARCHLLAGEIAQAVQVARTAVSRVEGGPHLEQAKARAVLAATLVAAGEEGDAVAAYMAAAAALEAQGARRQAAPVWRELAGVLMAMGRKDDAIATYERLASALGVPAVPVRPVAAPA
jgi:transcriptional regulator with XRE-family HTH domain